MGELVILGQNPPFPPFHGAAQLCFGFKVLLLGHRCKLGQEGEFGDLLLPLTHVFSEAQQLWLSTEWQIELCAGSFIHIPRLPPHPASLGILQPLSSICKHMIYDLVQVAPELTCCPFFAGLKLGGATLPSRWRGDC